MDAEYVVLIGYYSYIKDFGYIDYEKYLGLNNGFLGILNTINISSKLAELKNARNGSDDIGYKKKLDSEINNLESFFDE